MEKVIVPYCMTCGKIKLVWKDKWVFPELPLDYYQLSHGYCEPCGDKAIQEAMAEIAKGK